MNYKCQISTYFMRIKYIFNCHMQCQQITDNIQHDSYSDDDEYENSSLIGQDSEEEKQDQSSTNPVSFLEVFDSYQQLKYCYSESTNTEITQQKLRPALKEGYFTEYWTSAPTINEAKVQSFDQFLDQLKRQDFTLLSSIWGDDFHQKINFLIDNWHIFKTQYDVKMKEFLDVANRKIENISIYDEIYQGLPSLLSKISRKIQQKGNKDAVTCYQAKEDVLFNHYVNEQQAKAKKNGPYLLKQENDQRQLLGSYIAENKYFLKNLQTQKLLFFIGAAVKRYNINISNDVQFKKQCRRVYKFAELLLQNNQLTQPTKRLCCSKFYYMNFNIIPQGSSNLICRQENSSLKSRVEKMYLEKEKKGYKKVEDKVEVDSFNKEMRQLMLDICSLLNQGGGVVLLYARRIYLEAWVQGETILEDKKQFYIKIIEKELQTIKPIVRLHKQISISFVPVVKNPYEYDYLTQVQDEKDRAVNRNYIQGLYVPRINIVPSQAEKLYEYRVGNEQPVFAIYENNERKEIKRENLYKIRKQKQLYFRIDEEDEQTRELLGKDYLHVERHICPEPYKGHPILLQEQRVLNTKPDKEFKYMSMLVAHKNNHKDIQRKLINKGIDCMITDTFYNLKLKSSTSSAPIYHNIRFDQLLSEVGYNKEFEYNNRYILVVAVTTYIKILSKTNQSEIYPKANLHTLFGYVQKIFSKNMEIIELFRFINEEGEKQYYVKSTSREATLLIYYVMHHSGQKCIFKNPKSLDKIPAQERVKRWQQIYQVSNKSK